MDNPVIIFGAGPLGKSALEILRSNSIEVYCFLDDDTSKHNSEISGVSILGSTDNADLLKLLGKNCEAIVAEDDNAVRQSLVSMLNKDYSSMPINAIHNSADIGQDLIMGHGNLINTGVRISSFAELGSHGVFNTGSIVESGVKIGDFLQLGVGSIINPNVTIDSDVFIGSGVTIVAGVSIGAKARIGAGSVVVSDIAEGETVFGNPAKKV